MLLKLNKMQNEIERQKKKLDEFLNETHGSKGTPKRDEYEKLASGKIFRAKHFMVIIHTKKYRIEI